MLCGVLLAAGAGRRFGPGAKQLAVLEGRPLLQWAIDAACASRLDEVVLVLGARAPEIRAAVAPGRARILVAPDWEEGMAASLRAGVAAAAARGAEWAVVLLGDAPRLTPAAIDAVVAAAEGAPADVEAIRLRLADRPAHPVALRRPFFPAVAQLRGDEGARGLLRAARVLDVDGSAFADPGDVDTPEDLV